MRCAVIVFPGSNCDQDCVRALQQRPEMQVSSVWHEEQDLSRYDLIVLPGGFSYGDYLRCGAIASTSPIIPALRRAAAQGKFILGICNGFQILLEMGLLPGSLLRNENLQFLC
ncbi:MAG: phosphoribosylformylglycinamidine synthase subunit PurQ, partial [Enterobacteriaceae bacterium]